MNEQHPSVPYGYCHCGCGRKTALAKQTDTFWGYVKGEPVFYIQGHANRRRVQYVEEDRGYRTPCWIWQLWRTHEGYGHMSDGTGVQRLAHRVMWERANGPIPEGLQIDHLCVQPSCVNPDHLEPVTPAENNHRSRSTKFTVDQIREIRAAVASGETQVSVAARYGVRQGYVSNVVRRKAWKDV